MRLSETEKEHCPSRSVPQAFSLQNSREFPIKGIAKDLGALQVDLTGGALDADEEILVRSVASQMALALDREFIYRERENIRIAMEREHFKTNLLRSVSHDLRTPLTGIIGRAGFYGKRGKLRRRIREEAVPDINEEALYLNRLWKISCK